MERKLELKDIAGYLPYNAYLHYFKDEKIQIKPIVYFDKNAGYFATDMGTHRSCIYEKHSPKLVLRPLSDLYRTITHEGKEEVPIVELAKISFKNLKWSFEEGDVAARAVNPKGDTVYFEHTSDGEKFKFYAPLKYEYAPYKQHLLFDYLHSRMIDYRGLIKAGLAIDVNTIKNNPYK